MVFFNWIPSMAKLMLHMTFAEMAVKEHQKISSVMLD